MILILLASGRGSRLGKYTLKKPKCLVKINNKSILSYLFKIFNKFEKVFVVTGYKSKQIIDNLKTFNNCHYFFNKRFNTTNMVESLFIPFDNVNSDVIVIYSDIIFDPNIVLSLMKRKQTVIPVNTEWYEYWKKRMSKEEILRDAENIEIKNGIVKAIGTKIEKKIPDSQFMGIIRISFEDYISLKNIYKKIHNRKIDLTSFLNIFVNEYNGIIKSFRSNKFWLEIDSEKDIELAEELLDQYIKYE